MIELNPKGKANYCCLVLHGLGADGRDLLSLAPAIWPRDDVRWLFPDAPLRPITINGGMRMRGWYDVIDFDRSAQEDEKGIRESKEIIDALVEDEVKRGFGRDRIVLAGFSQGGAMALFTGLRQPSGPLAIVGLSCALPLASTLDAEAGEDSSSTPVFIGAGEQDEIIPPGYSQEGADVLAKHGNKVTMRTYPAIGHAIAQEEIADVVSFLEAIVPPQGA